MRRKLRVKSQGNGERRGRNKARRGRKMKF